MNATYEWLDNSNSFNTICNKYQLYEGNFIKDLIKIFNIAATISKIAAASIIYFGRWEINPFSPAACSVEVLYEAYLSR